MTAQKSGRQSFSPLLGILQELIMPAIKEVGMDTIVVARPTWKAMQESELPEGASITYKPLKSKRTPIRGKRNYESDLATLDARWPEDGLNSSRTPILAFVVAGKVGIQLGDYVLHCRPGHGILILPGTPHPDGSHLCLDDFYQQNTTCNMLSFKPWGNGVECWLNHTREGKHWSHQSVGEHCHVLHPQAQVYLETMAEESLARSPQFYEICDGLLKVFVALLLREIQELRAFEPVRLRPTILHPTMLDSTMLDSTMLNPAALTAPSAQNSIARVEEYVRNHLHENLSIDRVAAYVYMSRALFTRQFREATGKTFNEYVTGCRLEAAQVLLQNTARSISETSAFVGVTPARLRALFLQHLGVTPGEFRARAREMQK